MVIIYLLAAVAMVVLLFVLLHTHALDENEIKLLSTKRRTKKVDAYFQADSVERVIDPHFKKALNARGAYYAVDLPLTSVASVIAGLLKYKKHEWIVVAFERDMHVALLWINKGHDNSSASIYLSLDDLLATGTSGGYNSVLMFHNHPNPNPNRYDCTQASAIDINTANRWVGVLNPRGISVVKYVCERGRHHRYMLSPSDSFMPLADFVRAVEIANSRSWYGNLRLHMERIF